MQTDQLFDGPHFDRVGVEYDPFLPFIQPVTEAILARRPILPHGAKVLDLACGTGEPGLTLARRRPDVSLLGIDAAEGMVAVARHKAQAEGIANARFDVMPTDALRLADGTMDAVMSRFGALLFGDPKATASELARVLRPGGTFTLAVWEDVASNTLLAMALAALGGQLGRERMPSFEVFDALAAPGRREALLRGAGLHKIGSERIAWTYDFTDTASAWELVAGRGIFADRIALLDATQRDDARRHFSSVLERYNTHANGYRVPQCCRLFWGER